MSLVENNDPLSALLNGEYGTNDSRVHYWILTFCLDGVPAKVSDGTLATVKSAYAAAKDSAYEGLAAQHKTPCPRVPA